VKESAIQRQILDLLAAKGILAFRQNTGAMSGSYKGKKWFMRFGVPGMADILAFQKRPSNDVYCHKEADRITPMWIECKAPKGKQSELQKSFQAQVEVHGHRYIVAHDVDDVIEALR